MRSRICTSGLFLLVLLLAPYSLARADGTFTEDPVLDVIEEVVLEDSQLDRHKITNTIEGEQALQRARSYLDDQEQYRLELAGTEVYKVIAEGEPTYITVPETMALRRVEIQKFSDGSQRVNTSYVLNEVPDSANLQQASSRDVATAGSPWWFQYGQDCPSIDNNTGWMIHCYQGKVLREDGDPTTDFWALERFATHKSKSHWVMRSAWIDSRNTNGNINPGWHDWNPRRDLSRDPCGNIEVSVAARGVGISSSHQICEQWDITMHPHEPGHFNNTWRGWAWRSERDIAFKVLLTSNEGAGPDWVMEASFWAQP